MNIKTNAQFFELVTWKIILCMISHINGKSEKVITEGFIMPLEFTVYEQEHLHTWYRKRKKEDIWPALIKTYSVTNGEVNIGLILFQILCLSKLQIMKFHLI